jgi:hypothetical protein
MLDPKKSLAKKVNHRLIQARIEQVGSKAMMQATKTKSQLRLYCRNSNNLVGAQ